MRFLLMKTTLRIILLAFLFVLLTIISQWGGVIMLLSLVLSARIFPRQVGTRKGLLNIAFCCFLYIPSNLFVIPGIASLSGRVALPGSDTMTFGTIFSYTSILHRNYVSEELFLVLSDVATALQQEHPNSRIACLDACFPNIDGFPLIPHLSHDDGDKVDLAFFYKDAKTGAPLELVSPSVIGYGVHIAPKQENELSCRDHNHWQYNLLEKFVPQSRADQFILDEERTRDLLMQLCKHPSVGKIFIEPHLRKRLKIDHPKIRFQGCHSVRHDDHIHVQLK